MDFLFATQELEGLYTKETNAHKYPKEVITGFFEVMEIIVAALDTRDIRAFKSHRYEKLKGRRNLERSLRINKQWRLIVVEENIDSQTTIRILKLENHYE